MWYVIIWTIVTMYVLIRLGAFKKWNYKDSGVNIEEGNAFVQRLNKKYPLLEALMVCSRSLRVMSNLF